MAESDSVTGDSDTRELLSVGIDIGTSTTHLMLSALTTRTGQSGAPSTMRRVERYRSPVVFTPLRDGTIETAELESFLEQSFRTAGYDSAEIDTGAVIVTGEARRADNAEAVVSQLSDRAGEFACAMAGPNLEAVMSAHGSGAVDYSVENDQRVLHMDIGGGTTEFALVQNGFIEETASVRIGARLVELSVDGEVFEARDPARVLADDLPFDLVVGETLTDEQRRQVADTLAGRLLELIEGECSNDTKRVLTTDLPEFQSFDAVTCSGGVAEYIYGRQPGFYGDLGPELGSAVRRRLEAGGYTVTRAATSVRATVTGSTKRSTQISGRTMTLTDETVLPLEDVPLVPFVAESSSSLDELTAHILEELERYDVDELDTPFAFGFHLHGALTYEFLNRLSIAIVESWEDVDGEDPLVMVSDADVGMSIGRLVTKRVDSPVIAIDNVELEQFGYLDISEIKEETGAPLVTMKSLVF